MQCIRDGSDAVIPPPVAWGLAIAFGVIFDRLRPEPLMDAAAPAMWIGGAIFLAGLALAIWARAALGKAGTPVETDRPTTAVVIGGPYRGSRNPIYLAMLLGPIGLAIQLNSLWLLLSLAPLFLPIRYGVVAREEACLARKFGGEYSPTRPAFGAGSRRFLQSHDRQGRKPRHRLVFDPGRQWPEAGKIVEAARRARRSLGEVVRTREE